MRPLLADFLKRWKWILAAACLIPARSAALCASVSERSLVVVRPSVYMTAWLGLLLVLWGHRNGWSSAVLCIPVSRRSITNAQWVESVLLLPALNTLVMVLGALARSLSPHAFFTALMHAPVVLVVSVALAGFACMCFVGFVEAGVRGAGRHSSWGAAFQALTAAGCAAGGMIVITGRILSLAPTSWDAFDGPKGAAVLTGLALAGGSYILRRSLALDVDVSYASTFTPPSFAMERPSGTFPTRVWAAARVYVRAAFLTALLSVLGFAFLAVCEVLRGENVWLAAKADFAVFGLVVLPLGVVQFALVSNSSLRVYRSLPVSSTGLVVRLLSVPLVMFTVFFVATRPLVLVSSHPPPVLMDPATALSFGILSTLFGVCLLAWAGFIVLPGIVVLLAMIFLLPRAAVGFEEPAANGPLMAALGAGLTALGLWALHAAITRSSKGYRA